MRLRASNSSSNSRVETASEQNSRGAAPPLLVMSIPSETSAEELTVHDVTINEKKPFDASLTDDDQVGNVEAQPTLPGFINKSRTLQLEQELE